MKESQKQILCSFEPLRRRLIENKTYNSISFMDYVQFMMIKGLAIDTDSKLLSPSSAVDEIWHFHLLDKQDYKKVCERLCGYLIVHNGKGQDDQESVRGKREERSELLHQVLFRFYHPPQELHLSTSLVSLVFQATLSKRKRTLEIEPDKCLQSEQNLILICKALGFKDPKVIRLYYREELIEREDTYKSLHLSPMDCIEVCDPSIRC